MVDACPPPRLLGLRPTSPAGFVVRSFHNAKGSSSLALGPRAWRPAAKRACYFVTGPHRSVSMLSACSTERARPLFASRQTAASGGAIREGTAVPGAPESVLSESVSG